MFARMVFPAAVSADGLVMSVTITSNLRIALVLAMANSDRPGTLPCARYYARTTGRGRSRRKPDSLLTQLPTQEELHTAGGVPTHRVDGKERPYLRWRDDCCRRVGERAVYLGPEWLRI